MNSKWKINTLKSIWMSYTAHLEMCLQRSKNETKVHVEWLVRNKSVTNSRKIQNVPWNIIKWLVKNKLASQLISTNTISTSPPNLNHFAAEFSRVCLSFKVYDYLKFNIANEYYTLKLKMFFVCECLPEYPWKLASCQYHLTNTTEQFWIIIIIKKLNETNKRTKKIDFTKQK